MAEAEEMCWICLEEETDGGDSSLFSPCKCPRKVHPQCLARWQLQQAGRHEEKFCRFCNTNLTDWKSHLTPEELKPEVSKVQPIMVVYFEGQIHRIPVKQGDDGLTDFTTRIRELFRLPEDVDISLTFGCKEPMSGQHLKLEGMGAFDAAVHCASVAAADRQQKLKKSHSAGNLGARAAAAPAPAVARSSSNNHLGGGNGGAAAAESPRPRRFPDAAGGRSQSFHVRGAAGAGSNAGSGAVAPPGPPPAMRNVLNMVNAGAASSRPSSGSSRRLSVPDSPAPLPPSSSRRRASDTNQASPLTDGPSPSARSMTEQRSSAAARIAKQRYSSRNITELTDVPESDETVAVGSLSGKFKLHLKAFSRKVARGLSFNSKSPSAAAVAQENGASGSSPRTPGRPPLSPLPPTSPLPPLSPVAPGAFQIAAGSHVSSADVSGVAPEVLVAMQTPMAV